MQIVINSSFILNQTEINRLQETDPTIKLGMSIAQYIKDIELNRLF